MSEWPPGDDPWDKGDQTQRKLAGETQESGSRPRYQIGCSSIRVTFKWWWASVPRHGRGKPRTRDLRSHSCLCYIVRIGVSVGTVYFPRTGLRIRFCGSLCLANMLEYLS